MNQRVQQQREAAAPQAAKPAVAVAGPRQAELSAAASALNAAPRVRQLAAMAPAVASAARPNQTGLPDGLKAGVESLSGLSMDHVRVHYNSSKPAQLHALAYAQGSEIHLGPGQQKHLPHEAWHVVQQARGRVRPTLQMQGGVAVNDDVGLEREADLMGARAAAGAAKQSGQMMWPDPNDSQLMGDQSLASITNGARAVSQKTCANVIAQRIIEYKKSGAWSKRELLIAAIAEFFHADKERQEWIEKDVISDEVEVQDVTWLADSYYSDYLDYAMEEYGWAPPFEKQEKNDEHGPQLPVDSSIKKPKISVAHSSENTFSWAQKTMGHAQVILGGKEVFSAIKYSDRGVHAEPQMIELIDAFVRAKNLQWDQVKIRITINNFPCDHPGKECGKRIAKWATNVRMQEIHIYYANKYEGPKGGFNNSWNAMKSCGIPINLTPFKAEEYVKESTFGVRASMKFKPEVPPGERADPFSDSEDEALDGSLLKYRLTGEDGIDAEILNSVSGFIADCKYDLTEELFVVSGSDWACYIRCVLFKLNMINKYDAVMGEVHKRGIDISSGVSIGDEQETAIRAVITEVTGNVFHVTATDAKSKAVGQSTDANGENVRLLLTGAHFSLIK